jgi:hypothetical protein
MPHIANAFVDDHLIPRVFPIVGSDCPGMVCPDGDGQALWICMQSGNVEIHATTGGYEDIYTLDDSVTLRSTVSTGWSEDGATFGLNRVDGELYASFDARRADDDYAGTYLYRDTSVAKDGSGPWVLHGTVHEQATPYASGAGLPLSGWDYALGEVGIYPAGHPNAGRWLISHLKWYPSGGNVYGRHKYPALSYSDDDGVTWTDSGIVFTPGESDQPYGYATVARNFAWVGGETYWSWNGNVKSGRHFRSNGSGWDHLGSLGTTNSGGFFYVLSSGLGSYLHRIGHDLAVGGAGEVGHRYWQKKTDENWDAPDINWETVFVFDHGTSGTETELISHVSDLMVLCEADDEIWVGASKGAVMRMGTETPETEIIRNLVINPSGEQSYNKAWVASNGTVNTNVTWEV